MPWLISALVNLVIGVALSFVGSLIQQATAPKQKEPGVKGNITVGGAEPLSFILGRYGSPGHLEYVGTWGSAGDTPNAYLTHVISFSDLPIRGYSRFYVYGEPVTLGDTPHPARGYPVMEYRKGGKDHLWVQMYDGTQTAADPLLLSSFGSDPDRRWEADMIGRGVAYCVFTAKVNRELFSGFPEYFAEIDGFDLGDEDLSDNPIALIRQTLAGFAYDDDWLWGLQGMPASRTPAANWDVEIAKCNAAIDLLGGGTEKQFRAGIEVVVDQQPIEVINELLNSCSGRIAEIGGVYKVLVGAPGMPVASFTDDDIVITAGQSYEPFPGLESTYNGVNATYPEPAEKWGMKDAPALRDADLEEEDDSRRLPATVSFPYVYSGTQVQRLMQAMHRESRRFRNHSHTAPPEWWEYEVLDPVEWNSTRSGYDDKVFLITLMDDLPNGNQFVGIKEQEPTDYDWDPEVDEHPYSTAPLVIVRPTPQPMTGWGAAPGYIPDNDGIPRRPTIEVSFAAGLVDVRAVRVQVRLAGASAPVFDGELPYDPVDTEPSALLIATFISSTDYEVRGKYLPYSGRETLWSNQEDDGTDGPWLAVTTPFLPDVELPPIAPEMLGPELAADHGFLTETGDGSLSELIDDFRHDMDNLAGAVATASMTANVIRELVEARFGNAAAAVFTEAKVRATQYTALAAQITEVLAQVDEVIADGFLRFESEVDGGGALATITAKVKASTGAAFSQAAWILRAEADGLGGTDAYFGVLGTFYVFATADGEPYPAFAVDGVTGRIRFNDWDSIATISGVPIIQMHGSTGYFGILVA